MTNFADPTTLPVDALDSESLFTMHDGEGHVPATNRLLAWLRSLGVKVGNANSTPTVPGDVLYVTTAGATGYGPRAMVKLAEVTVSVAAASIDFTNIPQTFRSLMVVMSSRNDTGTQLVDARLSSDGTTFDAGSNYDTQYTSAAATSLSAGEFLGSVAAVVAAHTTTANVMSGATLFLPDYTNTSYHKTMVSDASFKAGTTTGLIGRYTFSAFWRNTAAIKGIRLLPAANNFGVGSTAALYGLPA